VVAERTRPASPGPAATTAADPLCAVRFRSAAGSFLAACGGRPAAGGPVQGAGGGVPARGGVLRAAFAGGGPVESLNPYAMSTPAEYVRSRVVYDELFRLQDGAPAGRLARCGTLTSQLM
jgi:hypothetical protein